MDLNEHKEPNLLQQVAELDELPYDIHFFDGPKVWSNIKSSFSSAKSIAQRFNHSWQLEFLRKKIMEIGSAIFYNQSQATCKLPTSIVSVFFVDDYGCVWFAVNKPHRPALEEVEETFPVKLDFYRKGSGHLVQVSGMGEMVKQEDYPSDIHFALSEEMVLVKVKIQQAEYYETRKLEISHEAWTAQVKSWASGLKGSYNLLSKHLSFNLSGRNGD